MSPKTLLKRHNLDRHTVQLLAAAPAQGSPDDLLTTDQVAGWLIVSPQTLRIWRMTKSAGPPFEKISHRKVRYLRRDISKWLESRKRA